MNLELIYQINQAVDLADDQIKQELLAQTGAIQRFVEQTSEQAPWRIDLLNLFDSEAKEPALIVYLLPLLDSCFLQLENGGQKPPGWVIAWHKKAYAWGLALTLKF